MKQKMTLNREQMSGKMIHNKKGAFRKYNTTFSFSEMDVTCQSKLYL